MESIQSDEEPPSRAGSPGWDQELQLADLKLDAGKLGEAAGKVVSRRPVAREGDPAREWVRVLFFSSRLRISPTEGVIMTIKPQARFLVLLATLLATMGTFPASAQTYDKTYTTSLVMYATKRSNVRAGPGTGYGKVGLLEVGEEVRVSAKIGSWFKLEPKAGQRERFVYAPLLASKRTGDSPKSQTIVVREAMELLSEAMSIARKFRDGRERARLLGIIAEAQASAGDTRGAQRTVSEALSIVRSHDVDDADRVWVLPSIAVVQARTGDTRGAQRTVSWALRTAPSHIEYPVDHARALAIIAEAQARASDTRGAQRTVSEALSIVRGVENGKNLSAIAKAQASLGNIRGAKLTVSEALRHARSGDSNNPFRVWDLAVVAEAQASIGDTRGAKLTISEALSAFQSLDEEDRFWANGAIAEAQASVGDFQGALSNFQRLSYSDRATLLAAIVQNTFPRTQDRPDDEFVAATNNQPSSTQNQQAAEASSESSLWGAFVLSSDHSGQSRRMNYAVAWNYPSRKAAIAAAADRCATKARRGNCGGGRVYYSEDTGYVTYVAFSTTSQDHDLSTLNNQDNSDLTHLFTGMDGDQRGKSIVLRRRCALVWSELDTKADYPNTPVVVFADSESRARAEFRSVWSKSANVSENWRNELTIYCNDQ